MRFDSLLQDARLALRGLRKQPGFTVALVLVLALGIASTATMFGLVDALLLRPLPYPDADRLTVIWQTDRETGTLREPSSVPDYFDFRERAVEMERVVAFVGSGANLVAPGAEPRRVTTRSVTHDLPELLGLEPLAGRLFSPEEDRPGAPAVALVGSGLWRSAFGADPAIVGKSLRLDDRPVTVVGVLSSDVEILGDEVDFYLPLAITPDSAPRYRHFVSVLGLVRSGSSLDAARSDLDRVAAELEAEYPENDARGAFVEPVSDVLRGDLRSGLWLLFAAVLAVLAIACANVASLLLARGEGRRAELALSAALGASGSRLAVRFLIESLLVCALATLTGLLLAGAAMRALDSAVVRDLLGPVRPELDWRVVTFAVATSVLVTVVFAMVPALQVRRLDLLRALESSRSVSAGRNRAGVRRVLVAGQAALAVVLLCGSGLLLASLRELAQVDAGFEADRVLRASFRLPESRYPRDFSNYPRWTEVDGFNRQLLEQTEALPGVVAATITTNHPLDSGFTNSFTIVGREEESREFGELKTRMVSPGYFETNGLRLLEGRLLDSRDHADATMALLVNEATVERYFRGHPVLGEHLNFWGADREIVGIVANERMHGLDQEAPPAMYLSIHQAPPTGAAMLMVRAAGDPEALIGPLRDIVEKLDPEIALYEVTTMERTVAFSQRIRRATSTLLGLFALAALGLTALGVYGVLSWLVARRSREVGVRLALGATRSRVVGTIVVRGLALVAAGVIVGLVASAASSTLLRGLLFGVPPGDPVVLAGAVTLLLVVAVLASLVPAWRASRVDPATSLRVE